MGESRVHGLGGIMESAETFRRIIHMSAIVYLAYYLIPKELFPGFYKWQGVVVIVMGTLIVEGVRLKTKKIPFGMRGYEKKQISAFAWFALGMGIALLFFKMQYVVPCVIGMAVIDPLIGESKRRKKTLYPVLPSLFYGLIMLVCLLLLSNLTLLLILLFTVIGTIFAIFAENWDIKFIDDDFLMLILPLLALSALDYLLSTNSII